MNCPNCTQVLREGARFCDHCGASVSSPPATDGQPRADGAAPTLVYDPLVGQTLDGKYELLARLGEGGMGVVYRARRVHINDEVAVKVLPRRFVADAASTERFRREARAAASLHHPNVVAIYDFGEAASEDVPAYIVMELLEGSSLRHLLERDGKLAPARVVALMEDIARGVGAAHRRGVLHRDLKPDNIVLLPADEDHERERVKVVDFGIAKLRDTGDAPKITETGVLVGTPYYMSPEQCRGEALDARADVYSLGAMLYELLAGTPPFVAETAIGVIAKHLSDPPPPLAPELGVPPPIEAVVMRALAKDPAARPPDAPALARELQEAARLAHAEEEAAARVAEARRLAAEEEERRRTEEERRRQEEAERRARADEQPEQILSDKDLHLFNYLDLSDEAEATDASAAEVPHSTRAETPQAVVVEHKQSPPVKATADRPAEAPPATESAAEAKRAKVVALGTVGALGIAALVVAAAVFTEGWRGIVSPIGAGFESAVAVRPGESFSEQINGISFELVGIRGGTFMMGTSESDIPRNTNGGVESGEKPKHQVTVKDFYMGRYEVTQAQWTGLMDMNPSDFKGCLKCPVEQVSWSDAQAFVNKLNAHQGKLVYRLPSEAEWEYACRAGTTADMPGEIGRVAWYKGNSGGKTHPVGENQPNAFGLYDMQGNVWEWCADTFHKTYAGAPSDGSAWTEGGEPRLRVLRGGSYADRGPGLRCASRAQWDTGPVAGNILVISSGLRLAADPRP